MHNFLLALLMTAASPNPPPMLVMQFVMQAAEARIIVRIPVYGAPLAVQRSPRRMTWREHDADSCQVAGEISRARFTRPGVLDLLMRDSRILRARLDGDCLTAGYYSAFYVAPSEDGQICAARDAIYSRAGSECPITGFSRLEAVPAE